jgi:hypothetical protein
MPLGCWFEESSQFHSSLRTIQALSEKSYSPDPKGVMKMAAKAYLPVEKRKKQPSSVVVAPAAQAEVTTVATAGQLAAAVQRLQANPQQTPPLDVLRLQATIGNRAVLRLLEEARSSSTTTGAAAPSATQNVTAVHPQRHGPVVQRALMSHDDLLKRGGKAKMGPLARLKNLVGKNAGGSQKNTKENKAGEKTTLFGEVLQSLKNMPSKSAGITGNDSYLDQLEGLSGNIQAWRKKHKIQDKLGTSKARALRELEGQVAAEKVLPGKQKAFWSKMANPQVQKEQKALEDVAKQMFSDGDTPKPLGAGGFNQINAHTLGGNTVTHVSRENKSGDSEADARNIDLGTYLPLLARSLGLTSTVMGARGMKSENEPFMAMPLAPGKSLKSLLKSGEAEDSAAFDKIKDNSLQQSALFDMIFEANDANMDNYNVDAEGNISRFDLDAVLHEGTPDYANSEDGGEFGIVYKDEKTSREVYKAGSSIVGLPQGNNLLTPDILATIRNWNPEQLQSLMLAASSTRDGANVFSDEQAKRVFENTKKIQELTQGEGENQSIRMLFEQYNRAFGPNEIDRYGKKAGFTPAQKYFFYGTGYMDSEFVGKNHQVDSAKIGAKLNTKETEHSNRLKELLAKKQLQRK